MVLNLYNCLAQIYIRQLYLQASITGNTEIKPVVAKSSGRLEIDNKYQQCIYIVLKLCNLLAHNYIRLLYVLTFITGNTEIKPVVAKSSVMFENTNKQQNCIYIVLHFYNLFAHTQIRQLHTEAFITGTIKLIL